MPDTPKNTEAIRVLFIGNSYTHTHDMPGILEKLAASAGARLSTVTRAPGGWSLEQHYGDKETRRRIREGGWDIIVLQDQSQRAAMPILRVQRQFFRYVRRLNRFIWWRLFPKPRIILYMTWGRRDGDADNRDYYPPAGTFEGMTALLKERYEKMAGKINAKVAPAGEAWAYARQRYPDIELYQEDGHHPSAAGSYLAACCFYATILGKDPILLTYDFTLEPETAAKLRKVASRVAWKG